ncbi:MAG: aminotransferase class V-fold PLP-dependent enzyme [Oscillospiraceae bacterium]|nr:aminotransferase class V-fold PLP-dependent enzyme [Oscillospiraceae bacterium]
MIYLDSAATTLQKPGAVSRAVARAIQTCASPGRGGHAAARRAEEVMFSCRTELGTLFGVDDPERVVFTLNATHALNLAIRTLVHPGDRVLISAWEHNAVTRTLYSIPEVEVLTAEAPLFDDDATLASFERHLRDGVDAAVCTAVSNVFGYRLPLAQISALCHQFGTPLIVDAAQAAGAIPLNLSELGAAFVACPGHKGLYGPQGTGVLFCFQPLDPLLTGGTGSESRMQQMPDFLPDRGEAGTHNVAGIAGLLEGVRYLNRVGVDQVERHEARLLRQMTDALGDIPGVEVFASDHANQCGVLSFRAEGWDCEELAQRLARRCVAVRAGLHCAPAAHRSAGTLETGTVRVSFSAFNTPAEVAAFSRILRDIVSNKLT